MSHSVRSHLRLEIDAYDEAIRTYIPGYETALARAAEEVADVSPALVVDLGAGTGALTEAILEQDRVGHVDAVDVDPEMLEQARERLTRFGSRVSLREASFDAPLPECDAVAASLALHHVPTVEGRWALHRRIFEALRPGGVFVNADVTVSAQTGVARAHLSSLGRPSRVLWNHRGTRLPAFRGMGARGHVLCARG